jgi:hypothetical protein
MTIAQAIMLHVSTVAMGAVVIVFGCLAPWYRTRTGATLFLVKVAFFIILVLINLGRYGIDGAIVDVLRFIAYPLTTITAISLLWVMIEAQVVGPRRGVDRDLFQKHQPEPEKWDGVERRKVHDE